VSVAVGRDHEARPVEPRRILGDDGRTLGVALTQTGKRCDRKYLDYVEITGQGQSELGFLPANLAAGKTHLEGQREALGAFFRAGSENLTIDGRPALRFRSTLTNGTGAKAGNTIETTWLLTFKGKTQYRFECTHQARVPHARAAAPEVERGCAEIVRTFKVGD
jgi:hypothetical protein